MLSDNSNLPTLQNTSSEPCSACELSHLIWLQLHSSSCSMQKPLFQSTKKCDDSAFNLCVDHVPFNAHTPLWVAVVSHLDHSGRLLTVSTFLPLTLYIVFLTAPRGNFKILSQIVSVSCSFRFIQSESRSLYSSPYRSPPATSRPAPLCCCFRMASPPPSVGLLTIPGTPGTLLPAACAGGFLAFNALLSHISVAKSLIAFNICSSVPFSMRPILFNNVNPSLLLPSCTRNISTCSILLFTII